MTGPRIATCNCGDLRAACSGAPVRVSVCHCLACQRRTGSAFSYNATFPRAQVEISGAYACFRRTLDSGASTYGFCPSCGSTVFYEIAERPGQVSIPVGAFADPAFASPSVSVCPETRHRWVALDLARPADETDP